MYVLNTHFSVEKTQSLLPPEHRIMATKLMRNYQECIVEGPRLPELPKDSKPEQLSLRITMHPEDGEGCRVEGVWLDQEPWVIGRWSTPCGFHDWLKEGRQ